MLDLLSFVARSCLFTKGSAARKTKIQKVRKAYSLPPPDVRRHLAAMIYEEAMETIQALGFNVAHNTLILDRDRKVDLMKIVDGCCDTIYVATGAMVACGVPDLPHLREVCIANDRKFPDGNATLDPQTGKYLKPIGWTPPDHETVKDAFKKMVDMTVATQFILRQGKSYALPSDEGSLQTISRSESGISGDGTQRDQSRREVSGQDDKKDDKADSESGKETPKYKNRTDVATPVGKKNKPRV